MYAQIDDEGNSYLLLDEIEDHRKGGTALTEQDACLCLSRPQQAQEADYKRLGIISVMEGRF